MNYRQAKKRFKKKYGINPNIVAKRVTSIDWNELVEKVTEMWVQVFNDIKEKIPEEFLQRCHKALDTLEALI